MTSSAAFLGSGPGSSFERVVDALHRYGCKVITRRPRDVMAQCPAHEDRTPSMHVWWSDGSTSVHCHAGCTGERPHRDLRPVLEPLGLTESDLFDEPLERPARPLPFRPRRSGKPPKSPAKAASPTTPDDPAAAPSSQPKTLSKPDLGKVVSSQHEMSYLYRAHDPDPERGPGYWERVDRIRQIRECGESKTFLRWHWDGRAWQRGRVAKLNEDEPPRSVLFNWPAVQRAIATGEEVWLVEGEKDALTLIELGMCATTNISGANSWEQHYTEALRGARVVLVLDRDEAGWKRGQRLAGELYPVAQGLRVVQPPVMNGPGGAPVKDVTDLVVAGAALAELEQLELGEVIELDAHRRGRQGGGRGDDGRWDHIPNTRPVYLYRRGAIVERTWRTGSDGDVEPKFSVLLDARAQITRVTYLDDGAEEVSPATHDYVVELAREDPETGELLDSGTCRVPADLVGNGRWPDALPWRGLVVGKKRAERDKAWDALEYAIPAATHHKSPIYATPGWRRTEEHGPIYVHAGGAISAGGAVEVETRLDGEFAGMRLPEPTRDPVVLGEAFARGLAPLLEELPGRIIAPLLGVSMWSVLGGPASHVTHLVGAPGTAKTFALRSVLQLLVPELIYRGEHQEMMSARNSTAISMTRALARAKDVVLQIDDFAPDDAGGAAQMQAKHATLARNVGNHSKRSKAERYGTGTENDPAPRGSVITTGELTAAGSAETRCLNVPVADGECNLEGLQERIENPVTAGARGLLGASFLSWCAGRLEELQQQVRVETFGPGSYQSAWARRLRDLPHNPGVRGRIADAVATATVGIKLLRRFLLETGVLDEAGANALWDWAVRGLDEVARTQDVEATDPATHFMEALRAVVASRAGYLADHRGDTPRQEDLDFAARYGWVWQPRPSSGMGGFGDGQWVRGGALLGEIGDERIKLLPDGCLSAVRAAAARADQRWADTITSLSAAMHARGWLHTTTTAEGSVERRVSVRVCGSAKTRAWVIDRDLFDGTDRAEAGGQGPAAGVLPGLDPAVVDVEPGAEQPGESGDSGAACDSGEPARVQNEEEIAVRIAELVEQLRGLGGDPLEHVVTRAVPAAPCVECGGDCALAVSEVTIHLACLLRRLATPQSEPAVSAAAAPTAQTPAVEPPPAPAPDVGQKRELPRPGQVGGRWRHAAAVLDPSGIYLPDGDRVGLGPLEHAGHVLAHGERLGIGHPGGPGQLWLTEALCEQLGLLVDPDPQVRDPDEQRGQVLTRLDEAGAAFLAPAVQAGWCVDRDTLTPITRLRRGEPGAQRVLELVVEPYQWVWDTRGTGLASGVEGSKTALPDVADPAARWGELARRAGRMAELLGQPFRMSAGHTGADLFDTAQRKRRRAAERGPAQDAAGRNRARVVELPGALPELEGQRAGMDIERPLQFDLELGGEALREAEYAHAFDVRKQYLPAAKSVELGYCTPGHPEPIHWTNPDELAALLGGYTTNLAKLPFGLVLVTLPAWSERRLPAPHHAQRADRAVQAWVSTPTLRLLLGDADSDGAGYRLEELGVVEAWIWPEQGRLLDGHWYTTLNKALAASADDPAMEEHLKLIFAGYIGRMASPHTRSSARAWHYQPVWRQAIIAAARALEWRKVHRAARERNLWPVAISADEVVYLAGGPDADKPATVAPAADNGRVGALRHSRSLQLDERAKKRVREHGGRLIASRVWTAAAGSESAIVTDDDPAARS